MKTMNRHLAAAFLAASSSLLAKPMDLQMGARGFAMGGAFAGVADDATAAYWNPAGLASISSLSLSETNWLFQDVSHLNVNYLTAAIPVEHVGTVSGSWLMQYALLSQGTGDTQVDQDWYENGFSLAGGRRLWDKLGFLLNTSVGVGLNRHVISSGDLNGAGLGIDVGLLTDFPHGVRLGLVGRNLGADMMGERIEPEYRMGLSYRWSNVMHRVLVAADLEEKSDVEYVDGVDGAGTNWKAFGGLEYGFATQGWDLALRAGANNTLRNSRDGIVWTLGAGVGYSGIVLQYAFQTDTRDEISLGNTHRITFELSLDAIKNLTRKSEAPATTPAAAETAPAPSTQAAPAAEPAPAAPASPAVTAPVAPAAPAEPAKK